MNRDILFATLIGFIVGLCITVLVLFGPKIIARLPKVQLPKLSFSIMQIKQKKIQEHPLVKQQEYTLNIDSPLPQSIETKDEVLVSGSAYPKSIVVVEGVLNDDVVVVNGEGKFASNISLIEGKNDIFVTNYIKEKSQTASVTVYFTHEEF